MALGVFVFKHIVRLWFLFALWWIRLGIMFLLNMLIVVLAFMNKLGRPADAGRLEKDLKCRLAIAVGCTRIFFFSFLTPTSFQTCVEQKAVAAVYQVNGFLCLVVFNNWNKMFLLSL